jgi:Zn-dependent M16 (insulinase) family peptidase
VSADTLFHDARSAGFELRSERELPEFKARGIYCRHIATGLEVFHLANDDPENLFAFAFRTPPPDSSGVAHILEHSVLCGSRRFPLKEPFLALLKSSLQTFLNAFTFADKTVYPASSMLEKDFFNLLLVYGDAVFFPLLREEVFRQEGHRLERSRDGLRRVGVVYNEMKGSFSSAETIVADLSTRSLFPDVPYGFESGGDPRSIPSLTYESFVDFHRKYYHPGNCRVFLYGNVPTARTLQFLQGEFLASFGPPPPLDSGLPRQPRWSAPRSREATYPAQAGPEGGARSSVTLNWLTVPVTDPLAVLAMEVASEVLVGNVGSPLQKALLESKLGEDLSPATGLDTELAELTFSVGLRGTSSEKAARIQELVLATLSELAGRGIPEEQLRGAVHRVEFRNREILRGGRPFSLALMRRSLRGWLHDRGPELTLEFRPSMDALKEHLAQGRYLEELIARQLVENPHRSTVLVRPDPTQAAREQEEERLEMKALEERLTVPERERLEADNRRLREFQEEPDSPEQVARLPMLRRGDLPREVQRIPESPLPEYLHRPGYFHGLHTNGVVYLDLALDASGLPEEASTLLPVFSKTVCGSGLPGMPYHQVATRLALLTGGFGATLGADSPYAGNGAGPVQCLIFRVKMLEENLAPALELAGRLLLEADFRDLDRLQTLVLELRNEMKASLVPGGSHYASLRAESRLSQALALEERWKGVTQLLAMEELGRSLPQKLPELAARLEELRGMLLTRRRLTLNLTCGEDQSGRVHPALERLLAMLPSGATPSRPARLGPEHPQAPASAGSEALVATTNVNFAAVAVRGSAFGTRESIQESLLAHFLSTGYLWEQVRMKGGAYGAGAVASGLERVFSFSSYRDPNITRTLEAFRGALQAARQEALSERAFEQVLIGAVGQEERPLAPGEKGFVALKRRLLGISDELRQRRRDLLLAASPGDLTEAAERLLAAWEASQTVVLAGRPAYEKAVQELASLAGIVTELPD